MERVVVLVAFECGSQGRDKRGRDEQMLVLVGGVVDDCGCARWA